MAIIVGAFGGGSIKGKLSGNVFQGSKYGQMMRNWVKPVDPSSAGQIGVRLAMATCASAWNGLSDANRETWVTYAAGTPLPDRFGNNHYVGARNMFIRTNTSRYLAGLSINSAAPPEPGVADLLGVVLDGSAASGIEVVDIDPALPTGGAMQISLSIPFGSGRNYCKGPFQTGLTILAADTLPVLIKAPGPGLVAGQKYWARIRFFEANGKSSNTRIIPLPIITA